MTHYIGIECSARVFYDAVVKIEGDMDVKEARKIAYEKVRNELRESRGQLDVDRSDIDDSELCWEVEGTSQHDYNEGYNPDFVIEKEDDSENQSIPDSRNLSLDFEEH